MAQQTFPTGPRARWLAVTVPFLIEEVTFLFFVGSFSFWVDRLLRGWGLVLVADREGIRHSQDLFAKEGAALTLPPLRFHSF